MPSHVSLETLRHRETRQQCWARQQLPDEFGECLTDSLCISPEVSLLKTSYLPKTDLVEDSLKQPEQPVLAITLGLTGESLFRGHDGTELLFRRAHTTVSIFQRCMGERHYRSERPVQQLRLLIGLRPLAHYLGEPVCKQLLRKLNRVKQLAHRPTTGATLIHANALLNTIESEPLDKLQVHIHVLSLLSEQLRHLDLQQEKRTPRHSQRDIKKLEEARTILEEQLDKSLTISELAAAVGMNECKLRKGFRDHFHRSPLRLLLEARMRKAWELLETGCQVSEAAYAVGYEHPSNFSAAFTRFFGRPPKTVFGPKR